MPRDATIFINGVIALGLSSIALSIAGGWETQDAARYATYLSLALIASTWKVKLPGMQGTISANFLFTLLGVAELGLAETMTMALMATAVQCLWNASKRPKPVQVLFNLGAISLSVFASYRITHLFSTRPFRPVHLAVAATVFFVINTGLVSAVLGLIERKRILDVWRNCHLWTFPYYLAGAGITAVMCMAASAVGWGQALLPLGLMYLLYMYYRLYVGERVAALTGGGIAALAEATVSSLNIGALASQLGNVDPAGSSVENPASS